MEEVKGRVKVKLSWKVRHKLLLYLVVVKRELTPTFYQQTQQQATYVQRGLEDYLAWALRNFAELVGSWYTCDVNNDDDDD